MDYGKLLFHVQWTGCVSVADVILLGMSWRDEWAVIWKERLRPVIGIEPVTEVPAEPAMGVANLTEIRRRSRKMKV